MKIGYDVSQTGHNKAGCGYYADSLLLHLAAINPSDEYILYPTFGDFFWDDDWQTSVRTLPPEQARRGLHHRSLPHAQAFWSRNSNDLDVLMGQPDVIHANNFYCPTGLRHTRLVYTLYDLSFLVEPSWTEEDNRVGCFEGVYRASLHADGIVAISDYTRQHFITTFPHYPANRIRVVSSASRFDYDAHLPHPDALSALQSDGFWLMVGTIEPRKNHTRLLEAYARYAYSESDPMPLVLAGRIGWLSDDFASIIAAHELQHHIIQTGYIDDAALQWLYQHCFALIYPSMFEGFGMPVLEAMSLKAAVITSNATSIPEFATDAALLIDPLDSGAIHDAMRKLMVDESLRMRLKQEGFQRSRDYSWGKAAADVRDFYDWVVAQPHNRHM